MTRRTWTTTEDDAIRAAYQTESAREIAERIGRTEKAVFQRAHELGLRKTRDWIVERARQAMLDPNHGGRKAQFEAGHTPWNKGIPFDSGGRSVETRFRPGNRSGRAQALWMPVGSLRINADGYLQRKVHDEMPMHTRWRAEHLVIWEAAHGPLPKGHAIAFKDGNRFNFELDNLECIPRAELMRRNSVHAHGPEIAAVAQLRGAITRQINRRNRNEDHQ